MRCFRTGTSLLGKEFQGMPTKQDLGTSWGFFSKFLMSTPAHFVRGLFPRAMPGRGPVVQVQQ